MVAAMAVCSVFAWGCEWNIGAAGARKREFSEYMRVGVRDPDRMKLEWRYTALQTDGATLLGVVIFWGVNGYGGYEFPSYYHVAVKEGGEVFFRESEDRSDVLRERKELSAYRAEEETALKMRLDGFFKEAEWQLRKLSLSNPPELPADLEEGDWSKPEQKRHALDEWQQRFEVSKKLESERAKEVEDAMNRAKEEHRDWRVGGEGIYYWKGLGLDVDIDARTKNLEERCATTRAKYTETWEAGMARLERLEQRINEAEREAETARERAQYGALAAAKARETEAAKAAEKDAKAHAAADEEQRRWWAAAEEKMQALEDAAVKFYAENHPTAASKYEIGDYRKNAAQLLLGIQRMTLAVREKREVWAETTVQADREALEQSIAASERRLEDLWQTLLVGIGVSKHTLQLERQSGRTLPRMKKSAIPFVPGNSAFARYEPYLRELAGEGR
jgi:hypothetical protein